jgi:hypothetical protein
MDIKLTITIIHLLGLTIGAGGTFMTDRLMLTMLRDGVMSKDEFAILTRAGHFVIGGLTVLFLSGIGLFFTDMTGYLASDKFIAKMIIVAILTANGYILHRIVMPFIKKRLSKSIWKDASVVRALPGLVAVGAVSFCSWIYALVLGSIPSLSVGFEAVLLVYVASIACMWTIGWLMARKRFFV